MRSCLLIFWSNNLFIISHHNLILGPASFFHSLVHFSFLEFCRQIIQAEGPSGPNRDYLFQLEKALLELGTFPWGSLEIIYYYLNSNYSYFFYFTIMLMLFIIRMLRMWRQACHWSCKYSQAHSFRGGLGLKVIWIWIH